MPEQRGRGGYRRSNSIKVDGEKKNGNSVPDGVAVIADITQTQEDQEVR